MKTRVILLLLLLIFLFSDAFQLSSRRSALQRISNKCKTGGAALAWLGLWPTLASAAPPVSVIAEELGYFPVTNKKGDMVYVPKKVSRESSDQAVALARHLANSEATFYGAFWCPHCARQKEVLGRQAFSLLNYVECSPEGYKADSAMCRRKQVEGYPTWVIGKGSSSKTLSGEVTLSQLAEASRFPGTIDEELEAKVPPLLGSKACQ